MFPFSGSTLEESPIGPVSCLNPLDIAVWTSSIPAPEKPDVTFDPADWVALSIMRHAPDDAFSASSSMGDSAYVSLPDAHRGRTKQVMDHSLQFAQEPLFSPDHAAAPEMFSPCASAMSYTTKSESGGFALPPAANAVIPGNFDGLGLSSQGTMWPVQGASAPTPVSMDYSLTASPVAIRQEPVPQHYQYDHDQSSQFIQQNETPANLAAGTLMCPSPETQSRQAGPSRSSSRATMSGHMSAHIPFPEHGSAHYGSTAMLRSSSHGAAPGSYSSSTISPCSPGQGCEPTGTDDWRLFLDIDAYASLACSRVHVADKFGSTEADHAPDAMYLAGADDELKYEDEMLERKRNDENARSDPLYNQEPDKDGNYHCPFAKTQDCGHPPARLKCNYE